MSSMPPEFSRKIAALIREYTTQLADVHTLRGMLTIAEQGLAPVDQWERYVDGCGMFAHPRNHCRNQLFSGWGVNLR
jgi:hypothetical protein